MLLVGVTHAFVVPGDPPLREYRIAEVTCENLRTASGRPTTLGYPDR